MGERHILHSDADCFYASVETVLDPSLRGRAVAVCGSTQERHGIVLAKSYSAKRAGVKTGMTNAEARRVCPGLITVPPRFDCYARFSAYLRNIYSRYTDTVEPFGLDECWLDITALPRDPVQVAQEIRSTVRDELGLTVSIGVSFNKVFAKLGSDMNKPDGMTVITKENYRDKVWGLPCSDLLFCSRATAKKLSDIGVFTVGDIAALPPEVMRRCLGKNGLTLWSYASGLDGSPVIGESSAPDAKSVGHGATCVSDIEDEPGARRVIYALSQSIGGRLREIGMCACGVHLTVKNNMLLSRGWQKRIAPTQSEGDIASAACELLSVGYTWQLPVRALTVTAIGLVSEREPEQTDMFCPVEDKLRRERLGRSIDMIRKRYGGGAIVPAVVLGDDKLPQNRGHDIFGEIFDPFGKGYRGRRDGV